MFDPRTQKHDHNSYDNMGANSSSNMERTRFSPSDDEREEAIQFRTNHDDDDDDQGSAMMGIDDSDSGVSTPPLWKSSPSSQPLLSHHIYTSLSPNSRVQAIARGQRELMEMVKSMPESSYELSLKDLVENHNMGLEDSRSIKLQQQRGVGKVKRQESRKDDNKNVVMMSFQNKGLFIKMVLPFSLKKSSKKKIGGKVSPKPEVVKGERDWWKKKFTGSSDSDSSKTSVNSGSSSRKKNSIQTGCWSFFQPRRSKSVD